MKRQTIVVVLLLLLLYAALAFGIYNGLTRDAPGANDFFSRWMGARALFLEGQNPYADEVTREIQIGMYGRLARPDEDQVAFAYPLYAAYFAAPLVAFPYAIAQALWMALLVIGVVASALVLARINRIAVSPLVLAGGLVGSLFFYPSVRGIFLGQYALVSFALIVLASLAIATEHDTMAGILLALSSAKPQPVIFLLPVILFWAWWNARRRIVWSTLVTLAGLMVSSFVLVPTWFTDFLNGLKSYARYAPVGPPLETFFKMLTPNPFAEILFLGSSGLLVVGLGAMVWRNRTKDWREFQPTLGLAALVTTLIAGRIGTPDQVLLMLPWVAWFGVWGQNKRWLRAFGSILILVVLPWAAFFSLLQGNQEAIVVTTILPLFTFVVFLGVTVTPLRRRRAG